jgi:hypothetical protein
MNLYIRDEISKKSETVSLPEDYSAYAYAFAVIALIGSVLYLFLLSL